MNPEIRPLDDVRREQIAEGQRMAREEGATERFSVSAGSAANAWARRSTTLTTKHKPKEKPLKGHEAFLKALETSGADVKVEKMSSGEIITGKIKHSDKYTITVRQVGCEEVLNRVIF